MNEFVVQTREQLAAAFLAGACRTHAEASTSPFRVIFGTATYTFRNGLHESRAFRYAKNANRIPKLKGR